MADKDRLCKYCVGFKSLLGISSVFFEKAMLNCLKLFYNGLLIICFEWRKFCNETAIIRIKRTVTCEIVTPMQEFIKREQMNSGMEIRVMYKYLLNCKRQK